MKLLVTGSRAWTDGELLYAILDEVTREWDEVFLVVGDARGADTTALAWAKDRGHHGKVFKARWESEGKGAGPLRNQRMIDANHDIQAAVAFFQTGEKNAGTKDCVRRLYDTLKLTAMAVWSK